MRKRSFLKLYFFAHILTMQKSFFEDSLASFGLRHLTSLILVDSVITVAYSSWSVLFSDQFGILFNPFNFFTRFVCFSLPFLQFFQHNCMRVSLIKLIQLSLISLCPLFLL